MDDCSTNEEGAMNLCITNETFSNDSLDHYTYNNKITKIMQLSEDTSSDGPSTDQSLLINNNNLTIKTDDSNDNINSSRELDETSPTNFLLKKTLLANNRKYGTSKNSSNETAFLLKLQEQLQSNIILSKLHNVDQTTQNQKFVEQFQILQKQYFSMQQASVNSPQKQTGNDEYLEKRLKNWNDYVKSCSSVFKFDTQDLIQCADSNDFSCDMKLSSDNSNKLQHLYTNGICKWPGCDTVCDNYQTFIKHLSASHILDDKSMAQARIQMQVVTQLGLQLEKERDRLDAMMVYFDITKKIHDQSEHFISSNNTDTNIDYHMNYSLNHNNIDNNENNFYSEYGPSSRRKSVDNKKSVMIHGGLPYMLERAGLDIHQEIQRNRDLYKTTDVRPPFTYASLIRQSILESTDKQLTLNEIYNWFQSTFCFFRRNAATWKNAVRHNLSLHKCFVRVENVKGAVWTVDEAEYYKRRPQKGADCSPFTFNTD